MQFLANENFPRKSVVYLRSAGYDVAYGSEDAPRAEDSEVIARAVLEGRIILTFDRDYGELIYRTLKCCLPGSLREYGSNDQ